MVFESKHLTQAEADRRAQEFRDDGAVVVVTAEGGGLFTVQATYN